MDLSRQPAPLYSRVRGIIDSARAGASRSVDTFMVVSNWLIGREIVEDEQKGKRRAGYGERILEGLAAKLKADKVRGYSLPNLKLFRKFALIYSELLPDAAISYTACSQSSAPQVEADQKGHTPCVESRVIDLPAILYTARRESWKPGRLHQNLCWSQYRLLMKVENPQARAFYEIEAIKSSWAARELERQINSKLYERLALSRDKEGLLRLASQGQEPATPREAFKDTAVLEFVGIPEAPRMTETALESALIDQMQRFLLELGRGFAFIGRQRRLTLEGDHFYPDLVFYHAVLKCYAIVDLKVGKLTHQDLGQMQLYVNYYDRERRTAGDNPTLGLILCTDKNDAVVRYTLGEGQSTIFVSLYKLHLPTEAELAAELKRELLSLEDDQSRRDPPNSGS